MFPGFRRSAHNGSSSHFRKHHQDGSDAVTLVRANSDDSRVIPRPIHRCRRARDALNRDSAGRCALKILTNHGLSESFADGFIGRGQNPESSALHQSVGIESRSRRFKRIRLGVVVEQSAQTVLQIESSTKRRDVLSKESFKLAPLIRRQLLRNLEKSNRHPKITARPKSFFRSKCF